MEKLKCKQCGNEKGFYRNLHLVGKVKVDNKGKLFKRVYDIQQDELFLPIKCNECGEEVVENGDLI